ncbi:MAG: hypothetical protein A2W90_09365 [Bacteroidetes bacterium GWF2_42_66]|nr:MAG: hypothetical protein A2W92_00055 [Bacteroidetes bacterium GWA2_42_15]OFY01717.1 MAG: hypothetical protein A2W89_22570 [Bacteroidetes bacterium GWE2_42_39]OFY46464.1 MAG: hypothetical protein A2W90_09365 [Bacteroidetes bacterium GWF2_42_66]HAZ02952.1 hypothetical protein [Marinilabiliales bacterium]HBL76131.1 hypothetical protein [Prolixibacteraceae bacterium]
MDKMQDKGIEIRKMCFEDIPFGFQLSLNENWNQTQNDWDFMVGRKENLCLVAICKCKIVATITVFNYNNQIAWIGMVLVDREFRGMGISTMLLNQAINLLQNGQHIKLDATSAGYPIYKKLKFKDEYQIFRMTFSPEANTQLKEDTSVRLMKNYHFQDVVEFDCIAFGTTREVLLKELIKNSPELAWVSTNDEIISGCVFGRKGAKYTQIGPLSARNCTVAKKLISRIIENNDHRSWVVDIPAYQSDFIKWMESLGFTTQREFMRMYLGENVSPINIKNQFLISGPEFG